jgi:hypothetical protein
LVSLNVALGCITETENRVHFLDEYLSKGEFLR